MNWRGTRTKSLGKTTLRGGAHNQNASTTKEANSEDAFARDTGYANTTKISEKFIILDAL